jgi:hypothetical protein
MMHNAVARDTSSIGEMSYRDIRGYTVNDYEDCNVAGDLLHEATELLEKMNHDPPQALKCLEEASRMLQLMAQRKCFQPK